MVYSYYLELYLGVT